MTPTKIPLSEILRTNRYAIKVTAAEQVKKLVPDYHRLDDMDVFFAVDPKHREFVATNSSVFYFSHPEGKEIIDYHDVEFDI